jgi:hypothetical protein
MTSAMWGIVVGMGLIFVTSLYRYKNQSVQAVQARASELIRSHRTAH